MQRVLAFLLLASTLITASERSVVAAARDYVFHAAASTLAASPQAIVRVQLINTVSGKPVTDAVIFQQRLDMSPDDMAGMTAPVSPLPSDEPGVYRFKADLSMAGRWALKLAAKVPGEQDTVHGEVIITASK